MNTQKEKWNQFIMANRGSFLQSFEWGEFQESLGRKIWRLEIGEELKALVVRHNLPLGKCYLYCGKGPIVENLKSKIQSISNRAEGADIKKTLKLFLLEVSKVAKNENAIFLKIESEIDFNSQVSICQLTDRFQKSKQIQPQKTLILDITKPEEELLRQMRQKTRYNIGLAQKKEISIRIISFPGQNEIDVFWRLLNQTAQRDKFHLHLKIYYQKMFEILGRRGVVKLFVAQYQNQIIATNIVCFFNGTAVYLHGASDYHFRSLMSPYLLQWQIILEAKKLGFSFYDFWGIDEVKWPGLTRFKNGFGGKEVISPDVFDVIYRSGWYKTYNLTKMILR